MVRIISKWLPFLDLNQRPPMIPRYASNFTCLSYDSHLLTQTVKVCPTIAYAEVEKFRLPVLQRSFAKANRKTFVRATFGCLTVT